MKVISHSEEETKNIARKIAEQLNNGDIVILSGDLGAGKTKFTEGFLSYYGLENEITSPTFTIINEYKKEKINIYHFDVYRIQEIDEFYAIGGDEYFSKGICIVEWGEIIENIIPKEHIKITFEKDFENENTRILNIEAYGKKFENIINKLQ